MDESLKSVEDFIKTHKNFIITTHESPDVDGLGAEIAFAALLKKLGKNCTIINSDPTPEKFLFLDMDSEINVIAKGYDPPSDLENYALVVLDTNDFTNIGTIANLIKEEIAGIFVIDHHEGSNNRATSTYVKVKASSASEIIYTIYEHFKIKPEFKAAQAMYAGILFDTGSFRYPKTSPKTFRIIADLVETGANPFNIYEQVYENNTMGSFRLSSMMVANMEVLCGGKLTAMKLTPKFLKESDAMFEEGEQNINLPLSIKGVVASLLVKQDTGGPVKISMRTKGDIDVSKLSIENGGGGHKNAAGYKSKLPFEEAYQKAIKDFIELMGCKSTDSKQKN